MDKERIRTWVNANGISLPGTAYIQMAAFQALVMEANKQFNLTAITSEADFAVKHFIDSLSLLPHIPPGSLSLLDIGTGAGFPGVVLKIARPELRVTLMDATGKKVAFLADALDKLGICAECVHARAEEWPRLSPGVTYDIVTARAVAPLDKLIRWALPLVASGGYFLAMKGPHVRDEIHRTAAVLKKYRATLTQTVSVVLQPGMCHTIIVIRKDGLL